MATSHVWINCVCIGWWLITGVESEGGYYQVNITGKPTKQRSTQGDAVSSRAVDGNPDSVFRHGSCTHTGSAGLQWWAVDLVSVHPVYSVTLVNRWDCCKDRLDNFRIYGYNDTFDPNLNNEIETCAELSGDFGGNDTRTFLCRYVMHSRFVGVQLTTSNILTLCEVYIYAACEPGSYGKNCTNSCSEHCKFNPCDRVTGVCPNGTCTPGFKGQTCDTPCPDGQYGENCINTCSQNCRHFPCDKSHGYCPAGECNAGFYGVRCNEACPDGQYGANCIKTCSQNCRHFPCDKSHGYCPSGECKAGFDGVRCDEDCPVGTYGDHCRYNCSATCNNQCITTSEIGECIDGCIAGFMGISCETECSYNTFAPNCQPCSSNCESLPCEIVTGHCIDGKCAPGFLGLNCTQKCPGGTFGVKCLSECFPNCKDACHHVDGSCRAGCEEGWTGENCEIKDDGTLVIALAVLLAVFVALCLGGIFLFIFRKYSKTTPKVENKRELTNTEGAYVNAPHDQVLQMRYTDISRETKYEDVTKKEEEAKITGNSMYEKLEQVQDEANKVYEELYNQ